MSEKAADDPRNFYFECPVWAILQDGDAEPVERVALVKVLDRRVFLMFTDEDLAERFLAGCPTYGWIAYRVETMEELAGLVRRAEADGATDVGTDAPPFGTFPNTGWFCSVADAIASVERDD